MAGEQYTDLAVLKLAEYVDANLPAKLRAVETAQGLTADSLTDPVEVIKHRVPFDNRSPLVEVYDDGWDFVDQNNRLLAVDCTVTVSFMGDADIGAGEAFMRRYMTALINTLTADPTLGGSVVSAILTDGSPAISRGDSAATRYVYAQGVEVHVYEG